MNRSINYLVEKATRRREIPGVLGREALRDVYNLGATVNYI